MVVVTIEVNAPGWAAQGIKEHLAMCLERYGDARVVSVSEQSAQGIKEQLSMYSASKQTGRSPG